MTPLPFTVWGVPRVSLRGVPCAPLSLTTLLPWGLVARIQRRIFLVRTYAMGFNVCPCIGHHFHPRAAPLFRHFGVSMGGLPSPPLLLLIIMGDTGAFLLLLTFSSSSWGVFNSFLSFSSSSQEAFLLLLTFSSSSWGVFNPFLSFSSSSWGVFIRLLFHWDYEGKGEIVPSATCSGGLYFYSHSSIRHSCGQGFFITGGDSLDTCQGTATDSFFSS